MRVSGGKEMSVKRYSVGVDGVDQNGNLVKYSDYAALEQRLIESERYGRQTDITIESLEMKLAQMAAENAGLKKFCKDAAFDADYEAELGMERGGFTDALNNIKTPATDAFLAEVRAQGVESFAESQKEYVRKNRSELDPMTRAAYCGSAVDAERFAAQLRKGVQP